MANQSLAIHHEIWRLYWGKYGAKGVCKPYSFHPCGNHKNQMYYGECPQGSWDTPKCRKLCQRGYTKTYNKDKFYAKSAYQLPRDEKKIRQEIMKNGPVQAGYFVYEDFRLYNGGIYKGVCKPYSFHPCGNHKNQMYYGECPQGSWDTPKCRKLCQRGYTKTYNKDKFYGKFGLIKLLQQQVLENSKSAYQLPRDEKKIRVEIMKNGPVQAGYFVYEDFRLYNGGIYKHKTGKQTGGHAVKIIGWGKENVNGTDVPYWLIANSWSNDWGENGFFRMVRGENDCNIEDMIYAGMMSV
ncbi:papain family cysteine protease [Ancylostoma duodenale]|uniref:Papain family cysteine protease n=1 Tax=Ancylostoma duodenale TaxID=51022 RepID=A0A0C2HEZ4_9BILA|nr:papain family cysteine protease [Ancylostoma duodenale]